MGCCSGCARWVIGIVSACVLVCSIVAAVYVYYKERNENWSELVKNNIPFWFIVLAACCAIVSSIIGFVLCCCKSKCLYVTYLVIIIVVILVEIAAIVLAFCFKDKIMDGINENWYKEKYKNTRITLEEQLKCCGFYNYSDGYGCAKDDRKIYDDTCDQKIRKDIDKNMKNLRICVIVMVVVEAVLLVCACYLACSKEEYEIK